MYSPKIYPRITPSQHEWLWVTKDDRTARVIILTSEYSPSGDAGDSAKPCCCMSMLGQSHKRGRQSKDEGTPPEMLCDDDRRRDRYPFSVDLIDDAVTSPLSFLSCDRHLIHILITTFYTQDIYTDFAKIATVG